MKHSAGFPSAAFICICAVLALPQMVAAQTAPAVPKILVTPTIEDALSDGNVTFCP